MEKTLALVVAFFIIFSFLSGCATLKPPAGNVGNVSANTSTGGNTPQSSNGLNQTIPVRNISRRAPPPLPE